ncbi:MAG: cadherin-like beta sandwich domain-containing protein [Paenibacillaceae bacterium]|nr:cadherin-like beta sandwich domain-containing protein [Paenibacillaceae bacterium]
MKRPFFAGLVARMLAAVLLLQSAAIVAPSFGTGERTAYADAADTSETTIVDRFDDYEWHRITGGTFNPDARYAAAMAYDELHRKVVMFGGESSSATLLADTWLWDGAKDVQAWQMTTPAVSPLARKGAGMAYDPVSRKIIMFGGEGASGVLGDTWLWDGAAWTQANGAAPSARGGVQMAYDGSHIVLFGGYTLSGGKKLPIGETWLWDGTQWQQQSPSGSPPAMHSSGMAYDGQHAVIYGGDLGEISDGGFTFDDGSYTIWTWDGEARTWSNQAGPAGAGYGGRWGNATAYDGRRLVSFSGEFDFYTPANQFGPAGLNLHYPRPGNNGIEGHSIYPYAFAKKGDTWESWLNKTSTTYPQWGDYAFPVSRSYASMAYDGHQFVVFGGRTVPGIVGETWTFGNELPTLAEVAISGSPDPVFRSQSASSTDEAKFVYEVTVNDISPLSERGLEYRIAAPQDQPQASWTRVPLLAAGSNDTSAGFKTQNVSGLYWNTEYEARAYGVNGAGMKYSAPATFKLDNDTTLLPPDVRYDQVGPAFLHVDDKKRISVVGATISNLLRKPLGGIDYYLQGAGGAKYPLAYRIVSDYELRLTWTDNLPPGTYDVKLHHAFFTPYDFPHALTITTATFYKPRNYSAVEVASTNARNETDKLTLRGPFVEKPETPGLYTLSDPNEPVAINDNVLFKGAQLEVDKRTSPYRIRGNGRLYVNGFGPSGTIQPYTLYEGVFEWKDDNFSMTMPNNAKVDYSGLGFPIKAKSIVFTNAGVRLAGSIDLGFYAGNRRVDGTAAVDRLPFSRGRFDLSGSFTAAAPFAAGPLDVTSTTWNLNSWYGYAKTTASALLSGYNMNFAMDLSFKANRLDGIGFSVNQSAKTGSTGTKFDKLSGTANELSGYSQLPQTFRFQGAATDVFAPVQKNLHLIETYRLNADISRSGYVADGDMYLYWFKVSDLKQIVSMQTDGFATAGSLNAFDIFTGPMALRYARTSGFAGQMKADVTIPNNIPDVGGKKVRGVDVTIDSAGLYASFTVNGIGVNVKYLFSKNVFEFELIAPPPVAPALVNGLGWLQTIGGAAGALSGNPADILDFFGDLFGSGSRSDFKTDSDSRPVRIASTNDMQYEIKTVAVSTHPGKTEATNAQARLDSGRFTAVDQRVAPDAELLEHDPSGQRVAYSFAVAQPYEALLVLDGDRRNVRLTDPAGRTVTPVSANITVRGGLTYIRLPLDAAGTWKLKATEAVRFQAYKLIYVRAGIDMQALAEAWEAVPDRDVTEFPLQERGLTLLTIGGAWGNETVYKPDGRPYALETDDGKPDWNAYRDPGSGTLYVLADAAETGDWFVDGGGRAEAGVYRVPANATMTDVRGWVQNARFPTKLKLGSTPSRNQALLNVYGAAAGTVVRRPDGTVYALRTDYSRDDWNAYYSSDRKLLTVLLDPAEAGEWTVEGAAFADVTAAEISMKLDNLRPLYLKGDWTSSVRFPVSKPGDYLLAVIGGDANTKITAPLSAAPMTLVFDEQDPAGNAILQRKADRLLPNDGAIDQADVSAGFPDPGPADVLYVTFHAAQAGIWNVEAKGKVRLQLTELPKRPELADVSASAMDANRYEVKWNVKHAEAGTTVKVMVTGDPEQPYGVVVVDNLPAAGVSAIALPGGLMPGRYYLSVVASGAVWAPMAQVIAQPIEVTATQTLPQPEAPELVSTGNGEATLRLHPVDRAGAAVTGYRAYLLKDGAPDPAKPAFDAGADEPELVLAGLATGQTYTIAVMAFGVEVGQNVYSPLSDPVTVMVPEPHPAALQIAVAAVQPADATVTENTYRTANGEDETMLLTSAAAVSVNISSDQAADVALYVDSTLLGRQSVAANGTTEFDLNGLLGLAQLEEREYVLTIEAVNDAGDRSIAIRKLLVDRTGPYLYAAYGADPGESLNGLVLNADRLPLVGQTEPGIKLTLNGARVPADENGRFDYFAPWSAGGADNGKFDGVLIAEDAAGNRTEYRFEALRGGAGSPQPRDPAELAALTLERGVFGQPFHPDTATYTTELEGGSIKVVAIPSYTDATVTVSGHSPGADGSVSVVIPDGGGQIEINVAGAGASSKTYTVTVAGKRSNVALLGGLTISANGEDVPLGTAFSGAQTSYDAAVGFDADEIAVLPAALQPGSAIRVNSQPVAGGSPITVALAAGETTTVGIDVTAPDGNTAQTYTLRVWREADGNARLQSLAVDGRRLQPAFDSESGDYRVVLPDGASSVAVSAQAESETAVVLVDGQPLQAGTAIVPLAQPQQRIDLAVTAQDGSERHYRVVAIRQLPQAAKPPQLAELRSRGFIAKPDLSPNRFHYTGGATYDSGVSVIAKATDAHAMIAIGGKPVGAGGERYVPLALGVNVVPIEVESADGTAAQTYTIELTRLEEESAPPNAPVAKPGVRTVVVETGGNDKAVAVPVVRSSETGGTKVDSVRLDDRNVKDIVAKAKAEHSDSARIVVTDLPDDPADEVHVSIPPDAVDGLAEAGISLRIATPDAEIVLSGETIAALRREGKELYFRIVPIRDEQQRSELEASTAQEAVVLHTADGKPVVAIGKPMTIETNYSDAPTRIVFPLGGLVLPEDEQEARRTLAGLAVYIAHSDGEKVVQRGTVVYGKDAKPTGLEIEVNKFSTFSVIRFAEAAETAVWLPYVNGYPDGTFRPGAAITRAELAAILARALKRQPGETDEAQPHALAAGALPFPDVPADHWAAAAIAEVRAAGIMAGDEAGLFQPERTVTRAEMATIVSRWRKPEATASAASSASFADTDGHWASPAIEAARAAGLMTGYEDGTFRPEAALLRSETVKVLNRMFVRPVPAHQGTRSHWPDVPDSFWAKDEIESAAGTIHVYADGAIQQEWP